MKKYNLTISLIVIALLAVCSAIAIAQYEDENGAAAVTQINPADIIPSGNNNGLEPQEAYREYGTSGSPLRNPVKYIKNLDRKPYPTNKWFTDFTFIAKYRGLDKNGQPVVDQFRDEQSPLSLRILDNLRLNDAREKVEWAGLYITAPKKPYLIVNGEKNPLMSDTVQFLLRGDDGIDTALVNPTTQTCDDAKEQSSNSPCLERTITSYGQLHLHTQWSQYKTWQDVVSDKAEGSMKAMIVRGSPYLTMSYNNLPIAFGSTQILLFAACKDGVCPANPQEANREYERNATGQVFKIIVGASNNRQKTNDVNCKDNPTQCRAIPYLFSVYMLYTAKPVTLAFENNVSNAQEDKSLWKLGHQFGILAAVTDNSCSATKCTVKSFNGMVRIAYAGSFPGPDDVSGQNLIELAHNAYTDAALQKNVDLLTRYSNVYPTSAGLGINTKENQVTFNWHTQQMSNHNFDKKQDSSKLLMMAFSATQLSALKQSENPVVVEDDYKVATLKGDMVAVTSDRNDEHDSKWTQKIHLPAVLARADDKIWFSKHPIDVDNEKFKTEITDHLKNDIALIGVENNKLGILDPDITKNDSYAFGKRVARVARIALIAEEMSQLDKNNKATYVGYRNTAVKRLKEVLSKWFITIKEVNPKGPNANGVNQGFFKYDTKFGGIVTANALEKPGAVNCKDQAGNDLCGYNQNFYNGQYTDHHFHYGYFIYAAAVVTHFDTDWGNKYKDRVNFLVRDIANTVYGDEYFPHYRYFDWFEGHGMANGLGPTSTGRNQESSSEAVNAWYAITLWGAATHNSAMRDIAKIMTAEEIHAAQTWWQITPNTSIYKNIKIAPFSRFNLSENGADALDLSKLGAMGIIWESQADGATFFGYNSWYRLGIQMLPYTPITEDLFTKAWVQQNSKTNSDILNQIQTTMLNKINVVKNLDAALADYAKARDLLKNESDATFWGAVQGRINDPYTWSYLVLPIKALVLGNNVEEQFENLIAAANQVNKETASYPFKRGENGDCAPSGVPINKQPAVCIVYSSGGTTQYIPVGLPLMLVGYDGIDSGVSRSNLDWWFATRGK